MQKFRKTLITSVGRQMLTDVDGAKGKLTYTKATLYSQDVKTSKEADIIAVTGLTGPQLETDLQVTDVKDNTVTVLASFNNAQVTQDLTFNSIGWFAKTSVDDKEQLMAITPSETEQTLVAGSNGASTSSIDIEMVFGRSHDTTVVLSPSQVGVASSKQLEAAIERTKTELTAGTDEKLKSKADKSEIYPRDKIDEMLSQAGKLKKISVNGDTPVEPDDKGVANIVLPDLNHPDYTITTSPFDLDLAVNLGIYRLNGVDLTTSKHADALTALPSAAIKGAKGFLIQKKYDDYYNMQILVLYDMPNNTDITWSFRCIGIGTSDYRDTFKRITTDIDYTTLLNQVNQKANTNDVYTKFQTDNRLSLKANTSDIYTRSQIDNRLGYKANASDVYTQSQIDNKLASISVGGDIDAINRKLADKANVSDVYSKSQADSRFGGAIKKIDGYSPDSSGNMNLGNTYATINSVNKKANASDVYTQSQADSKFGGAIKTIDGYYPDSQGRYYLANTYETINNVSTKVKKKLSNLSNPDYSYTGTTLDVDNIANPGVYFFEKTKLSSSMNSHTFDDVLSLPYNCGYLIIDDCYFISIRCQAQFLLNFNINNPAISIYVRLIMPGAGVYGTKFKAIVS